MEAPILADREMVVRKIVLDHKGRFDSRFTVAELRLVATLTNMLSLAAESIASHELRTNLARKGLNVSVLKHEILRCIHELPNEDETPPNQLIEYFRSRAYTLKGLEDLYKRTDVETTVGEELALACKLLRPQIGIVRLRLPRGKSRARLPRGEYRLCWILLTVLGNAIRAVNEKNEPPFRIEVANKPMGDGKYMISIRDWGEGIPPDLADILRGPPRLLALTDGQGSGFAYARLLAAQSGWRLDLKSRKNPTRFDLVITTARSRR